MHVESIERPVCICGLTRKKRRETGATRAAK